MDPDLCIIRIGKGDRLNKELTRTLDPVDVETLHQFVVTPDKPTELHYHDFDEYWFFTEGRTVVTLLLPDGTKKEYGIGPGDLVVTPRGVEHGHIPHETVKGIEFISKKRPNAKPGHLYRK